MAIPRLSKMFGFGKKVMSGNAYTSERRQDNIKLGKQLSITPGGRHAWFETPKGRVRKPL